MFVELVSYWIPDCLSYRWLFITWSAVSVMFVSARMDVVHATSLTLKKLLSTKSAAAFIANYCTKCHSGTLTELLHPFKHDSKKKVW